MSAVEPTVRPHPRIRERRVAVRREAGRRRLRLVIGLAAVAASVGASWGLTRSPLLDVDTIEVTGAIHTDPQVLLRAAGVHQGRAMVDLDPPAAAADVERLPWVAEATIVRKWPATVEVRLTERVAVAVVRAADDAWALTDATGRVLAVVAEPPEGLTAVDLVVDTVPRAGGSLDARGRGAVALAASAADVLSEPPSSISIDDAGATLVLGSRLQVMIGPLTDVVAKLMAVATIVERVGVSGVSSIDVRVPGAPVLTRG